MKKWLTIVLAVLMTVVLFGCSTTTETTDTPATPVVTPPAEAPDATGTEEETTDETIEEAPAASKWDTEVTVDYATFGDSGVNYNDYENDAMAKWVYDNYKIVWEIIPLDWSNWTENFRIWVNAGDLPTQCFTDFAINDFAGYVEQGLIKQFPEGWEEKYPNLYTTWQLNGISSFVFPNWGGTFAQVHAIYFQTPCYPYTASWALNVRKDWIEKAGFEVKTAYKWSELEEIMTYINDNYDAMGLTKGTDYVWAQEFSNLSWALNYAFDFEANVVWDETAQQYVYGLDREEDFNNLVAKIDAIKRGYTAGWIHPDLFTFTANREARDIFDAGNSFITFEGSFASSVKGYWNNFEQASGLSADDCFMLAIMMDENEVHHMDEALNYWACTVWNPNIDDDLFDRLLSFGNYRLSEEGKYFLTLGFEGEDWEMGENGRPANLRDLEAYPSLKDKYPCSDMYASYFICSDDYGSYDPSIPAGVVATCDQTWADKQAYSNDKGANDRYDYYYNMYNSDIKSKFNMDWDAAMGEIISTGAETATAVQAFIDQNRTLIDEVLADVNANVTPQRLAAN